MGWGRENDVFVSFFKKGSILFVLEGKGRKKLKKGKIKNKTEFPNLEKIKYN